MGIIEDLDKEGIHLQETILNLESQGYGWYYDLWLRNIWNGLITNMTIEMNKEMLRRFDSQ